VERGHDGPIPEGASVVQGEDAAGDSCVVLEGPLLLRQAEDLRAKLLLAVQTQDRLEIDCAGVTEADLSGLQTLLSAARSARRGGKPVLLRGAPSPALRDAVLRAGFPPTADAAGFSQWLQGEGEP
jgi:anti-anti-sigma regulatory factor